jgi:hypothetical protein
MTSQEITAKIESLVTEYNTFVQDTLASIETRKIETIGEIAYLRGRLDVMLEMEQSASSTEEG